MGKFKRWKKNPNEKCNKECMGAIYQTKLEIEESSNDGKKKKREK